MLPQSIQEVIKEEAKVLFDKDPFYNTADAVRSGYIEGATKWAERMEEFVQWLSTKNDKWQFQDLLKTFFEQSKQKK